MPALIFSEIFDSDLLSITGTTTFSESIPSPTFKFSNLFKSISVNSFLISFETIALEVAVHF